MLRKGVGGFFFRRVVSVYVGSRGRDDRDN